MSEGLDENFLDSGPDEENIADMPALEEAGPEISPEGKIAALEAEKLELIDKMQRSLAEFDNYRKRSIKEKGQMFDEGVKDTINKILPVVDNLERAVSSFENKEDNTYKGFEMILRQLLSILSEGIGVKPIDAVGKQFNTEFHYAVSHVEDGAFGENEVIEELQKGYVYKEKVIRCSMVKVVN
ncbi:MAG: nucleotide exchange factor GrpE [Clostridiales bacterium]|jgi:molecular chaperone GrpE|nr:nucleotide exchange factor GrpE [Clostridiales bacterium]